MKRVGAAVAAAYLLAVPAVCPAPAALMLDAA